MHSQKNKKPEFFYKFGSTLRSIWFLLKIYRNQWRDQSELKKIQEKMFLDIFKHAYENTTFYHRLYRKHDISPNDVKSLDDIIKLPIITKQDLKQYPIHMRISKKFNIERCSELVTSGSTGEPFKTYQESLASDYLKALHFRRLMNYGYKPWKTIVIFGPYWATNYPTIEQMSLRKGIFNIFDFDFNRLSLLEEPNKNVSYLRMIKPHVIWCVPSYLRLLAQEIRKMGDRDIRPQILICGGEMLDKHTRSFIEEVFKVKIFDEYGAVDVASRAVAWQCNLHNKYHQNIDGAYLEFIKEGEHVSPGEEGHIVATNLFRYAAPMIRYSIGDLGIPSEELCSCGITFPLMESIQGRSDDCLIMPDGGIISPHTIMSILQNIPGINRYQITQTCKNKIIAFIDILSHQQAQIIEKNIRLKFSRIFDKEVQLHLVFGPIPINKEKKYRAVKSNATI